MSTKITEAFKDEFNIALADLKKATANAQLQGLLKCLRKHNLLYVVERINAEFTLTHKANRGGLLLSPHNVHRNGSRIYQCGADLKQLTNALCMELAASGRVREEHLTKNALLIGRAAGLLAPINGSDICHTRVWAQGFEDATTKPRAPDLPKGIHKRKASFICKYTKPCGSVGYKTQKTLEDAVAFMDPEHGEGKGDKDDSCGKDV